MEFLLNDFLGTPTWMWAVFISLVLGLLALDLGVLHKNSKEIGIRESLLMSGFYIAIGLAFGGWIWYQSGQQSAMEYVTGFVVEKSLAMDNIFIIAMIFSYFAIPRQYQHRVLLWGILGVIVLRGIMIAGGAAIVENFHWVLYLFAAFLVFTGLKMLFSSDHDESDIGNNRILKFLRSRLPVTEKLHGEKFFVKETDATTGKLKTFVTPLFLALIMVEIADLIFAVDSIPAIFAITTDPFIVYTSNIFAILGLRALYFALAALIHRFAYLKYALAAVLVFVGSKIFVADMLGIAKIPPAVSLGVTVAILATGIIGSLIATRKEAKAVE
ncbi:MULTISPECIES: TerC family protein [Agrobacterium tumefaciens complex]|jgi:tellurite resistance protein TerC|uniref:Tellurite resistance protein TerC n=2 Tax=Agrobacterium tumefaciens TaxID=358 RepID=A0AAW8LQC0_AGRTU|nr:TerC family protein [Agrobacterium tumefaciens]AYM81388.1 transporter [Agrobacterium tumefaciens]EHH04226.1 transporter [Agrobacterium tumefaciens CCNWGS0286]MBP2533959.1 tellurite resistance protein TerC [Agrobacterium tumefaciens]MBP2565242.1 tellurite resistance protein TerC [Agrobacterium tumefaciens]MDR6700894.1 tellurite resistance protein TerC [Agrobacterium tumefaciens]